MRVAIVAESYLPHMNGVTGSVLHCVRHLEAAGHETLVVAAAPPRGGGSSERPGVALLPSLPLPGYPQVRVALARAGRVTDILRGFAPDVVHLASPFVLGWRGLTAAEALVVPTVAVYQTDVIAYARNYGVPLAAQHVGAHVGRLHRRATLTLAPSSAAQRQLAELGVERVRRWGRGVDTMRFSPERRSDAWRNWVAPGRVIVGYVGRLAPEKQVDDLAALAGLAGVQLVIVGDGPSRARLEARMPGAIFLGHLSGDELTQAMASFDVFVHPGESETFGQTLQEAHASGVPVVATGVGGPVDLVRSSIDGWLYRPGDLDDLRARVQDLVGDEAKRRAFSVAAHAGVQSRTWPTLVDSLIAHYDEARGLHARTSTRSAQPAASIASVASAPAPPSAPRWRRYVALGDSITEGLCDTSRMPAGEYRGWADRVALLIAQRATGPVRYANLAVRSRRVQSMIDDQLPRALELRPDLVSILIGANDLLAHGADIRALGAQVEHAVARLRAHGCDVLLVTPFLPRRRAAVLLARRFDRYAAELRRIAEVHGARLLDVAARMAADEQREIGALENWAPDRVHLSSRGHRLLAYRAAEALGMPDSEALGALDATLHADEDAPVAGIWLVRDVLPWAWRRVRGRTAGDGLAAKHDGYVSLPGGRAQRAPSNPL